jgi:hypothetical protein
MSIPELHQITKVHGLLHAKLCIELAEIQLGRAATADSGREWRSMETATTGAAAPACGGCKVKKPKPDAGRRPTPVRSCRLSTRTAPFSGSWGGQKVMALSSAVTLF